MNHFYSSAFHKLIRRIETLRRQLQRLVSNKSSHSVYKKQLLQKQYERYLQKLAAITSPAIKAGAVLGLTTIVNISAQAQQQPCSNFHNAVYSNPIKRVPLSYLGLGKPSFVDIDDDGDYDCYEEYYDNFGSTHRGYVIFLRNNGTKNVPYYEQDTATGFPSTLTLDLGTRPISIDGAVFADIDGDGDYDCLLASYLHCCGEKIIYFENTGTKTKPVFTERDGGANPFNSIYGYYGLSYALADLDSDGDYDLIATNYAYTRIYTNVGTATAPKFLETQSDRDFFSGHVNVYDWNKDGLIDYFNSGFYFKNIGTAQNAVFTSSHDGPRLPKNFYMYQFADLNNDSFVEVFDSYGNFATTAPDALIKADSAKNILQAYPKNTSYTYSWQRNGKQIPNATFDHYTPKLPGLYTVKITGDCGSGISYPYAYKTAQKTLSNEAGNTAALPLLSVNKLLPEAGIKAYPNPFTHSFTLQIPYTYRHSKTLYRITDLQGRLLQTGNANDPSLQLGSTLSKGIYIVQLTENNAVVHEGKIMKE